MLISSIIYNDNIIIILLIINHINSRCDGSDYTNSNMVLIIFIINIMVVFMLLPLMFCCDFINSDIDVNIDKLKDSGNKYQQLEH